MSEMVGASPAQEDPFAAAYSPDTYGPALPDISGMEQPTAAPAVPLEAGIDHEHAYALNPDLEPWGGRIAITPFIEVTMPVTDMTATEERMPGMLGGAMQFARMMQEGVWATILQTELPPPTETVRIPISMN